MEKFYGFHYNWQKKIYKLGIICGIVHHDYQNACKKGENFKDIILEKFNSFETIFIGGLET